MFFAEDSAGQDWLFVGLGAVLGGLPGVLAAVLALFKGRADAMRMARADVLKEWQEYVDKLQARVDQLLGELEAVNRELRACEASSAEMKSRIAVLEYRVRKLNGELSDPPKKKGESRPEAS